MRELTERQSSKFLLMLDAIDASPSNKIIELCRAIEHNQPNVAGKTLIDIVYSYEALIDERKNG